MFKQIGNYMPGLDYPIHSRAPQFLKYCNRDELIDEAKNFISCEYATFRNGRGMKEERDFRRHISGIINAQQEFTGYNKYGYVQ